MEANSDVIADRDDQRLGSASSTAAAAARDADNDDDDRAPRGSGHHSVAAADSLPTEPAWPASALAPNSHTLTPSSPPLLPALGAPDHLASRASDAGGVGSNSIVPVNDVAAAGRAAAPAVDAANTPPRPLDRDSSYAPPLMPQPPRASPVPPEPPAQRPAKTFATTMSILAATLASWATGRARAAALAALRLGPVPQHVAFIMDGNRRFARARGLGDPSRGHVEGFRSLEETLDWCLSLGVRAVTVFAFSIENFSRDPREVEFLMALVKEKFDEFAQKADIIERHRIAVRVIGNLDLLPPDVLLAASRAVLMTRHNTGAILNVCIPYTSRDELAAAARDVAAGLRAGHILPEDLLPSTSDNDRDDSGGGSGARIASPSPLFDACLLDARSPPLDILVRTSGEARMSDFLLWQTATSGAALHFVNALWPDFSFWTALPALLRYQLLHCVDPATSDTATAPASSLLPPASVSSSPELAATPTTSALAPAAGASARVDSARTPLRCRVPPLAADAGVAAPAAATATTDVTDANRVDRFLADLWAARDRRLLAPALQQAEIEATASAASAAGEP
ncbi:hypothetical protein HK405_006458 [Cladochytrium tenue]|nr:hypothetical protein HK405_006458 [Cladochytrium tenue]